jgi:alkaline phosphatase
MKKINLFIIICFLMSCAAPKKQINANQVIPKSEYANLKIDRPKNIILMIGDGMGLGQITAGMYMNNNCLELERCTNIGIHKSYSADDLITDSAAGATAFASGIKTKNGYLGLDTFGRYVGTIMDKATSKDMATGLVVTSTIVHATPAAFYAHQKDRDNYEDIAKDMLKSNSNLLIGGGQKYFTRRKTDSIDLIETMIDSGYTVTDYFQNELEQFTFPEVDKLCYFTADGDPLPVSKGRTYLPLATKKAIQFLKNKRKKGFFLMIEGSQIDWGGHANEADYIITEMLDFNQTIGDVLDFARQDKNTLVIITADHETGGFAINPGSIMGQLKTAFTTKKHTAAMIPVFAFGPGAQLFNGIYENTEIYSKMNALLFNPN